MYTQHVATVSGLVYTDPDSNRLRPSAVLSKHSNCRSTHITQGLAPMRLRTKRPTDACRSRPDRRWPWLALGLLCGVSFACSDAGIVVLGDQVPRPYHFDSPQRLEELSIEDRSDNPSLTSDLLEIYFTAARGFDRADVWTATRTDPNAAFDTPVLVSEVNSSAVETSPIVAEDGLTLWIGSDRAGGIGALDVWVATRDARGEPWSTPKLVPELSGSGNDLPRLPGQHRTTMPLSSDRDSGGLYQIYFATRTQPSAVFATPRLVPELSFDNMITIDGFLSDDGLTVFWDSGPEFGAADMYVAWRRSTADRFEHVTALSDLNTPSNERDPWLSPDGRLLFFSSDRGGRYEIYVAAAHRSAIAVDP